MTDSGCELSIIMVSYNTRALTLAAIGAVYRHPPHVPFELLVLDNASADDSADAIRAAFPAVRLIEHPVNTGFAGGNNIAAGQARGRRLLLLNPDTEVFENCLAAVWDFAEREPHRGIWGGQTRFGDGSLNPTSCWRRITLWSVFCGATGLTMRFPKNPVCNPEGYGGWQRDTERPVDIVSGCFFLIDRPLWDRLGGFDPQFFMYAEEADLCLRAARLGACPAITPAAVLIHYGGKSEVSQTEKVIKVVRGRVTLMRKHWGPVRLAAGLALYRLWALIRMVASRAIAGPNDDPAQASAKWRAIWDRRREWLAGY